MHIFTITPDVFIVKIATCQQLHSINDALFDPVICERRRAIVQELRVADSTTVAMFGNVRDSRVKRLALPNADPIVAKSKSLVPTPLPSTSKD